MFAFNAWSLNVREAPEKFVVTNNLANLEFADGVSIHL